MAATASTNDGARPTGRSYYPPDIPRLERGEFVYYPEKLVSHADEYPEYFEWIKRFRMSLPNGQLYFGGRHFEELEKTGHRAFLRLQFPCFAETSLEAGEDGTHPDKDKEIYYASCREVFRHPDWLIVTDRTHRRPNTTDPPAYYYDYGNTELRRHLIGYFEGRLAETGYHGIFFDYLGSYALPDEIRDAWGKKHSDLDYNEAAGMFLAELRKAVPGTPLFGNMAYRNWEHCYPHLDYDMKESHGTGRQLGGDELELMICLDMANAPRSVLQRTHTSMPVDVHLEEEGLQRARETRFRPWDGDGGYKKVDIPRREAERHYPNVKGVDLNFIQPWYIPTGATKEVEGKAYTVYTARINRPAIFYGYALAKLNNRIPSTSEVRSPALVRDEIFFLDLGQPVEDDYRELEEVVVRYFENGFVLVTRGNGVVRFQPDGEMIPEGTSGLWDTYGGTPVWEWELRRAVDIHPDYFPASNTYPPSGRVYVYRRQEPAKAAGCGKALDSTQCVEQGPRRLRR
jgi:hypothetical protein